MPLQLRANLHWCDSSGRAVFLDVEADRYFCLSSEANAAFLRLSAGDRRPGDPGRLSMLAAAGILVESDSSVPIPPPPVVEAADGDWPSELRPRAALPSIVEELVCEALAAHRLRTKPFSALVEAIRRGSPIPPRGSGDQDRVADAIAAAAGAAAFLTRAHDRCLVRALAVHSICTRRGIRSKLVFGVIAHPFAAHCWVQLGSKVLVGGFEQARLYTPILVLE